MSKEWRYVSGDCPLKRCSVCTQELSLDNFYKQKDGKYGVTSRCKPCLLASNRKYANPEKQKEYSKRYSATHRDKVKEACSKWRRENLAYDAFRARTYRSRKQNQIPSWADLVKIKDIYLSCPKGFHVDHIIPLKGKLVSGLHVENNLQYLPAIDNIRKRNIYYV